MGKQAKNVGKRGKKNDAMSTRPVEPRESLPEGSQVGEVRHGKSGTAPILADFNYALKLIGYKPIDNLNWLIKFASLNIEELSSSLIWLESFKYQVTEFAYSGGRGGKGTLQGFVGPHESKFQPDKTNRLIPRLFEKLDILKLQETVKVLLSGLGKPSAPLIPIKNVTLLLGIPPVLEGQKEGFSVILTDLFSAFLLQATLLIGRFTAQIRKCEAEDCPNVFVFQSAKKKFCSSTCQVRIGSRKNRAEKKKSQQIKGEKNGSHAPTQGN